MPFRIDMVQDARVARINWLSREIDVLSARGDFRAARPLAAELCTAVHELVGAADPAYATVLDRAAKLHLDLADYNTAEALLRASIEVTRNTLGENDPALASRLNGLALIYKTTGRLSEASVTYEQALSIYGSIPPSADSLPDVVRILRNLAHLRMELGQLAAARELLNAAQAAIDRAAGDMGHLEAAVQQSLGRCAQMDGDYAAATRHLRRALRLARTSLHDANAHLATIVHELAGLFSERGRYRRAERLLKWLLAVDARTVGENHPAFASDLGSIAQLQIYLHNYSAAQASAGRAVEIYRGLFGELHADTARALNTLAEVHRWSGRLTDADRLHRRALEIRRRVLGDEHPDFAASLHNLALVRLQMADFASVRTMEDEALRILSSAAATTHPLAARILSTLAASYEAGGDYGHASELLLRALALERQTLGNDHAHIGQTLNNLGTVSLRADDFDRAESYLRRALDIFRRALGDRNVTVSYALNNLGTVLSYSGRWAEARPILIDALAIRRETVGSDHPLVATSLVNLAHVCAALGDSLAALGFLSEAIAVQDKLIGDVFAIGSERQRLDYLRDVGPQLDLMLSLVSQFHAADPTAVRAAFDCVLRRKGIVTDALALERGAVMDGTSAVLRSKLKELTALKWEIAERTLAGPAGDAAAHEWTLAGLRGQREELEAALASAIPQFELTRRLRAADLASVERALPSGSTLVELVRFASIDFSAKLAIAGRLQATERYAALVLDAGAARDPELIDLGPAESIDTLVTQYRALVCPDESQELDPRAERAVGSKLRFAVLDPVLEKRPQCARLLISSDGELLRLPFEILQFADGGRVIDNISIVYLSSGRDILRIDDPSQFVSRQALVMADPDFDLNDDVSKPIDPGAPAAPEGAGVSGALASLAPFPPLPDARVEGTVVAEMLGVRARIGRRAVKRLLKRHRRPRVLHIATHGFFLPNVAESSAAHQSLGPDAPSAANIVHSAAPLENPMLRSGLVLAGANTWCAGGTLPAVAENGFLTAEDVSGLDLLGTELVVLSACETGLGDVERGEGVFGLRRAFVLAGARTLVMSLWKVPDADTRDLIKHFYQRILEGSPRVDALRSAQQSVRRLRPEPFYWGAFILQGDFGPLRPLSSPILRTEH